MTREIPLTKGLVALVDDEDFAWLSQWKWHATHGGYAGRGHGLSMHRQILEAPAGLQVDHVNHDRLDNRRTNIRICSGAQNRRNVVKKNRLGFRGIHSWRRQYRAQIHADGKSVCLGLYLTAEDAARAYDAAAREHHGAFAVLNFPEAG